MSSSEYSTHINSINKFINQFLLDVNELGSFRVTFGSFSCTTNSMPFYKHVRWNVMGLIVNVHCMFFVIAKYLRIYYNSDTETSYYVNSFTAS